MGQLLDHIEKAESEFNESVYAAFANDDYELVADVAGGHSQFNDALWSLLNKYDIPSEDFYEFKYGVYDYVGVIPMMVMAGASIVTSYFDHESVGYHIYVPTKYLDFFFKDLESSLNANYRRIK
jgi:hypothetical protein